jgi:hypothetical protein
VHKTRTQDAKPGRSRVELVLFPVVQKLLVAGIDLLEAGHRAARALGDPERERRRIKRFRSSC